MNKKLIAIIIENSIDKRSMKSISLQILPDDIKNSKNLKRYILKKSLVLDGLQFAVGSTVVLSNGDLMGVAIKEKISLKPNLTLNNVLCLFDQNRLIGAKIFRPMSLNGLSLKANQEIYFHDDKSIRSCVLAEDTMVKGIPLNKGSFCSFFKDGSPKEGVLAKAITINGIKLKKGFSFEFSAPKVVKYFVSETNVRIGDWNFAKSNGVFFYENQQLWTGTVASNVNYDGLIIPMGSDVFFDEKGMLVRVEVEGFSIEYKGRRKDICFAGIEIKGIKITTAPSVESWNELKKAISFKGYVFPKGSYLEFNKGMLERIETRKPLYSGRKKAKAKTFFIFDKMGKMKAY